jgi:type II secretory pathway component PulK
VNRRGVALVLVLWIIVLLGGLGAHILGASRTTTGLAANQRAAAVARSAAESGVIATAAEIERTLIALSDSAGRAEYLNTLVTSTRDSVSLGSGRFAVALMDPSSRLDVNAAPVDRLASLFALFTDIGRATEMAQRIRATIERDPAVVQDGKAVSIDGGMTRFVSPLRSLEALREIPGLDAGVLDRAAPYLTVDGDGTVNRRSASDTVLRVAFGELREAPSRLVIVARGWESGNALTHEVQAVYALSGTSLALVHWREQVR